MSVFRFLLLMSVLVSSSWAEDREIVWREDFTVSLEEARQSSRPLFVTFRCLPCKQCASFDKSVLEGGPVLAPLLKEFITVRLTDAKMLDGRYFPYRTHQDLDLSWWGYFLSPEGQLYGVFGGKDHISDTTRISEAALANTMKRILRHHRAGGETIAGKTQKPPTELAAYRDYAANRSHLSKQTCLHCHQVADILITESIGKDTFAQAHLEEGWPLPENIGLLLDRDHGLLVTDVAPGSAAQRAGIRKGDTLVSADQTLLFSQADFRGALHRAARDRAKIEIGWMRDKQELDGQLITEAGWKKGPNWWRKSVYDGVYGPYLGFFPLRGPRQGKGSLSIRPFMGKDARKSPWWDSGLRPGHEIIELGGRTDDWNSRELLTWFRSRYKVGDEITIKVRNQGKEEVIKGKVPAPKHH